jgi:two-component system, sensor histidine kinase and response regulator
MQADLPRVLAVDDEPSNLSLLERLLAGNHHVVSVANGQAALDRLAKTPFDLVLLDIMMPGMTGLQTLERIRNNPQTANLPVILISALGDAQDISRGLEMGANDYIVKPIDVDITLARVKTQVALKRHQDERESLIAELQAAQELKDRFLQIASHDLKGPLSNMRMAVSLMRESMKSLPDSETILRMADASLNMMHALIKDFLDTAAMQNGALKLHMDRILLELFIFEVVAEHQPNALHKNIALEIRNVEGAILADSARFRQVVGNLVSNAIKYSPPDTTIRLWTESDDSTVSIYIADQGPGIPAEEQSQLFTQFGKLSPRPTGDESSTGLGLWIVKQLVNLQNGEVGLISPPEGGSTFWIRMPIAD